MKNDDEQSGLILALLGIIPVIWFALLVAPYLSSGLMGILEGVPEVMNHPFSIQLCGDSVKTVLIFFMSYGMGIGIYLSTRKHYRRGEEHGSAKWGNVKKINRRYREKRFTKNKLLTMHVRISYNMRKHLRNVLTVVIGGSGSGKTRFFAKPNLMQANTSFVVLDPNGKEVLGYILQSSPLNTAANKRRKGGQKVPKIRDFNRATALYERLSKDDEQQGESNSILNQKRFLEDFARKSGMTNIKHFTDDGYTGRNFNRPGFQAMLAEAEAGKIGTIIVKDMSRFGRNYLEVGFYTEILFPKKQIRFIAINNSVDSDKPQDNDFTPFLNIMNEWYAKDTSNKIKSIFLSRMNDGKRCSGSIPYGYNRLPEDKQTLVVDPVASQVVKHIFELAAEGLTPPAIARQLTKEKVLIPSAYTLQYHPEQCNRKAEYSCTSWNANTVREILSRQEYLGHTVLRKTIGTNFKTDERRFATDEERLVFEDTHEPIVDGELWEQAHRRLKHATRRIKKGTHQEECLLPGLVYCADCGSKMSYQTNYYKSGEPYHSFRCSSYGNRTVNCTIHHISDKVLYQLVLRSIQRLSSHIIADERGFAEELKSKWEAQANGKPQKQKDELQTINRRLNELDRLIGSLYENFISGLLPEKQYKSLMKKYSTEQDSLESQVSEIQEKLEQTKASSAHIGRFIRLIKKYKQTTELTKEMACKLIDKIAVHEAVGKKPNRQQQVDIYYNFIGQFDLPLSEKEIAEARRKAEREAAEKVKRKKRRQRESNAAHRAKTKAERWAANDGHKYPKRICEQCGKEFYPNSTRQRFCNTDCTKAHQQAEKEKKRFAEKGEHTFRQKVCKICGKPFWPSNGQEVLCSEECKTINRRQKQLAYYHRKQSEQKAGEAI